MRFFNKISGGFLPLACVFAACAFALSACGKKAAPKMPPVQVSAVTVRSAAVPVTYEYPGRVAGFKETEVRARVGGILLKRNFTEGARVAQNQLLFEIDPSIYEAEVNQQKAQLEQAKANYAQSVLDANRAEELLRQKVQSVAYRDQMVAKRDVAAAAVQQAQAQLRQAELNLQYTKVTAPIGGMTSREHVSEGSLIATDASANLLTSITQTDPVYINFSYAGSDAQAMRAIMEDMRAHNEEVAHLKVRIRFGSGQDYGRLGTVDFTSPTIDANTGALSARATVANPDGILTPGEFVRLIVEGLEVNDAIIIPEQALMQDSQGQFVYVVTPQSEVEKRPVAVSRQLGSRDWLLERGREEEPPAPEAIFHEPDATEAPAPKIFVGLHDGERVITEGQFRIGTALALMPKGAKLKVALTTLDGKNIAPPAAAETHGK